jgi:hypothetical protein
MNATLSGSLGSLAIALLTLVIPGIVNAQTLPLLRDLTVSPEATWWVDDHVPTDGVDEAITGMNDTRWISPDRATTSNTISRLLRRPDITPSNAVALAELFGASSVLIGVVYESERGELPLLGLSRCELGIQASLLSVETSATIASLEFATSAYAERADDACSEARSLLLAWVTEYLPGSAGSQFGIPSDAPTVQVASPDGAAPYVALRDHIRRSHPEVIDLVERWASEGNIAVELILTDETDALSTLEDISHTIRAATQIEVTGLALRENLLVLTIREATLE